MKQKKLSKDEIIIRQKRHMRCFAIIMIVLGILCMIKTFEALRYQMILDGVKTEFKEFTKYQVEILSYCIEEGDLNKTEFFNDFLRFKTEELIQENNK